MTTIAARDIESGLEVVPQAWASNPEVHDGNFPEVHHGEDGLEVVPIAYKTDKILYDPIAPATPWWRRKKMIIFGAVGLIVVAVALGAGLGVGLLKKANSSGPSSEGSSADSSGTNTGSRSGPCSDSFCTQKLAISATPGNLPLDDREDPSETLYLARVNSDGVFQYRSLPTDSFNQWEDDPDFGTPGDVPGIKMSGRPSIVAWVPTGQNLRIEFFSVDVSSGSLMQRGLQNSTWTNWAKIAAGVSDRVVSCRMGGDLLSRADVWFATTKDKIAGHSSSAQVSPKNSSKDAIGYVPDNILTQGAYPAATAPGITCRQADIEHNLVLYHLDTRTASVRQWNVPSNAWSTAVSVGDVRFIDEPVVVDVSKDRFDFLGIGEDDALYHFSWVGGTLGKLEQIGKGFASAPSGVSFGSSDRLDVVAVGIDGRLRHRSLLGEKWSADWDDLGIDAAGAPLLAQSDGNIHLFVSGEKDEVRHAVINGTNVATKWDIRDSIRTLD